MTECMPIVSQIDLVRNLVLLCYAGILDVEAATEIQDHVNKASLEYKLPVLMDLREAVLRASLQTIGEFPENEFQVLLDRREMMPVAVIMANNADVERFRFFERRAQSIGAPVAFFLSETEALVWLAGQK